MHACIRRGSHSLFVCTCAIPSASLWRAERQDAALQAAHGASGACASLRVESIAPIVHPQPLQVAHTATSSALRLCRRLSGWRYDQQHLRRCCCPSSQRRPPGSTPATPPPPLSAARESRPCVGLDGRSAAGYVCNGTTMYSVALCRCASAPEPSFPCAQRNACRWTRSNRPCLFCQPCAACRFAVVQPMDDHSKLMVQQEGLDVLRRIQGTVCPVAVIGPYRSGKVGDPGLHARGWVAHGRCPAEQGGAAAVPQAQVWCSGQRLTPTVVWSAARQHPCCPVPSQPTLPPHVAHAVLHAQPADGRGVRGGFRRGPHTADADEGRVDVGRAAPRAAAQRGDHACEAGCGRTGPGCRVCYGPRCCRCYLASQAAAQLARTTVHACGPCLRC